MVFKGKIQIDIDDDLGVPIFSEASHMFHFLALDRKSKFMDALLHRFPYWFDQSG